MRGGEVTDIGMKIWNNWWRHWSSAD